MAAPGQERRVPSGAETAPAPLQPRRHGHPLLPGEGAEAERAAPGHPGQAAAGGGQQVLRGLRGQGYGGAGGGRRREAGGPPPPSTSARGPGSGSGGSAARPGQGPPPGSTSAGAAAAATGPSPSGAAAGGRAEGGEAGRPRGRPPTRSRLSGLRSGAPRGLRVRAAAGLARFFLKFDGPSLPPAPAGVGQAGDLARPRRGAGAPRVWCWASEAMPFGVGSVPPAPGSLNLDVNRVGDPALVVNGILKIVSLSNLNLGLVW